MAKGKVKAAMDKVTTDMDKVVQSLAKGEGMKAVSEWRTTLSSIQDFDNTVKNWKTKHATLAKLPFGKAEKIARFQTAVTAFKTKYARQLS